MSMKIEMTHGAPEMFPAPLPVPKHRRDKNDEDETDARANEQHAGLAIFAKELQSGHRGEL